MALPSAPGPSGSLASSRPDPTRLPGRRDTSHASSAAAAHLAPALVRRGEGRTAGTQGQGRGGTQGRGWGGTHPERNLAGPGHLVGRGR